MTKNEFSAAFKIAKSNADLSKIDDSILYGYGLPGFKPVFVTLEQIAKLIRYQTFTFAGGIDAQELNEVAQAARKVFLCVIN